MLSQHCWPGCTVHSVLNPIAFMASLGGLLLWDHFVAALLSTLFHFLALLSWHHLANWGIAAFRFTLQTAHLLHPLWNSPFPPSFSLSPFSHFTIKWPGRWKDFMGFPYEKFRSESICTKPDFVQTTNCVFQHCLIIAAVCLLPTGSHWLIKIIRLETGYLTQLLPPYFEAPPRSGKEWWSQICDLQNQMVSPKRGESEGCAGHLVTSPKIFNGLQLVSWHYQPKWELPKIQNHWWNMKKKKL